MPNLAMPRHASIADVVVGLLAELSAVYFQGFQFMSGPEFDVHHDTLTVVLPPGATSLDMLRGLLQLDHGKGREDFAERDLRDRLSALAV